MWRGRANVGGPGGSLSVTGSRCCRSFRAADRAQRHSGVVLLVDKATEDNVSKAVILQICAGKRNKVQ